MEESSQQSMMDAETQPESEEASQMSLDQDCQESQMDTLEDSPEDVDNSQQDCEATIPKQPKIQDETEAEATMEMQEESTEPDKDECKKETEKESDDGKEGAEKSVTEKGDAEGVQQAPEEDAEEEYRFPDTLEGFKYAFNEYGQMRHIETNKPFEFLVRENNMWYNQRHYEALGEVITEYVYGLLETETNLKRVYLGIKESEEPRSFVFMTENALTTTDKLMVLIHGSGVVRAGQWARRLIINDCLDSGTQIPFIKRAVEEGYEVLVMNTNDNYATGRDGHRKPIKGSSSPKEHTLQVWDKFVAETPAEHVAIVAHSYGGVVTVDLAVHRTESFKRKVFAVAFTDSVHYLSCNVVGDELHTWFINNVINWVSSSEVLGTVIDDRGYDCPRISAGTTKHEETSWYSFQAIFEFFKSKEYKLKNPGEDDGDDSGAAAGTAEPAGADPNEPSQDKEEDHDKKTVEEPSEEQTAEEKAEEKAVQESDSGGSGTEV